MSQIMVLAAIVVGTCAVLAATGFRGRQTVVGIDLGTTYSVVGVNEAGKISIIPGPDGNPLLPSVVSFLDNGVVVVGRDALELLEDHPTSTIYGAKRFIGRSISDEAVTEEAKEHQFGVVQTSEDALQVSFQIKRSGHPATVSPQSVGSHVVAHLLKWTGDYLGHKQVNKAVIAVPAKFDPRQRAATVEAFRLAGLQVIRMLEEPTAAALAFGLHRKPNVNHILVYDFGGGTLDVSILFVNDGSVDVIGSDGDDNLGGSDFDQCVTHALVDKLEDRLVELADFSKAMRCNFERPTCALHNLYPLSEALRRQLTEEQLATVVCMAPPTRETAANLEDMIKSEAMRSELGVTGTHCEDWESVRLEVTRAEYEEHCNSLFERGLSPVSRLLRRLDLSVDDIDEVVMVGGMTRTPRVRESLMAHLGVTHLNVEIDPDVVVAHGAATVAH